MSELQLELTPTNIAVAMTNEQIARQSLMAAFSEVMPKTEGKQYLLTSKRSDAQMELATVINHDDKSPATDAHKPAGVRLAKMLNQYDDQPSSQLWSEIQRLAREILK